MSSKKTYFHIVYDGPSLENNEMDIKELAPALLAISEVLEETNRLYNRGRAEVAVNVKGSFKTGCFGFDLSVTQDFLHNLFNLLKTDDVIAGATLLGYLGFIATSAVQTGKGLLQVVKWLRNRPITKIEISSDNKAKIYVDEDSYTVEKEIIELLKSYKIRKAIESAITVPLEKEGVDSFACAGQLSPDQTDKFIIIKKEEAKYFIAPEPEDEVIEEHTYITSLQAVSVVFQEKNKWRFSDGTNTFFAEINDGVFAQKVQNNDISFAKNDIFKVELYTKQTLTAKGIKTEYTVNKVIGHRSAARQLQLPIE